jgi:hypothetical protein
MLLATITWREISRESNKDRPTEALREIFKDLTPDAFRVLLTAFEDGPACVAPALYGPGVTLPAEIYAYANRRCSGLTPHVSLSDALLSKPGLAADIAIFAAGRVEQERRDARRREVGKDND